MLKTVIVAGCMLVAGVTLGALLVGHQGLLKKWQSEDIGLLGRVQRAVVQSPTDRNETPVRGAIYTIWGRTRCPNSASLIYKGIVGGGSSAHVGAGSEYICLLEEPAWNKTISGFNNYGAIYGAEFKAGDGLFNMENVNGATLMNQNAVCAVCRTTKTVQLMIPGTQSCMTGWHTEYYGYLMGSKWDGKNQRNYICMDRAPEADRSGEGAEGGSELWPIEADCGYSLPCPHYGDGKELTCAVCSNY